MVKECEYQAIVISDHAPLLLTLCIPASHDTYHPWHFNTLLLSDADFVKFVSKEITEYVACNQTPGMSSSVKSILELDMKIAKTLSPDLSKQRLTLQTEFNLLSTRHAENLINQSQHRIYEYGRRLAKFWLTSYVKKMLVEQ